MASDTAPSAPTASSTPPAPPAPSTSSTPRAAARALVSLAGTPRRGEPFEVRTLVAHPMETGHRVDALGNKVPRDIVRRIEARLDGELVFAADMHPAIAANPYLVFPLVAQADGTLVVSWSGDLGFAHSTSVAVRLQ